MNTGLQLGRPGIYMVPERADSAFRAVRLDVAGFVGVALRGPVDTPVLVASWSDYERRFGAYQRSDNASDRLLPYAVRTFFDQGGTRAYVVRVAPPDDFAGPTSDDATARFTFDPTAPDTWGVAARGEGTWGDALDIRLDFDVADTFTASIDGSLRLLLPRGTRPAHQSLIRVRGPGLPATGEFRTLTRVSDPAYHDRLVELDRALPLPSGVGLDTGSVEIDVITATLHVADRGVSTSGEERLTGLGLSPGHPRFVGRILNDESQLVVAVGTWDQALFPDRFLTPRVAAMTAGGLDRSHGIDRRSFFDDGDADADLLDEFKHHRGADALGRVEEIGLLCVPDLTWRAERSMYTQPTHPGSRPVGRCNPCAPVALETQPAEPLPVPHGLDASVPEDFDEIVWRQLRLVRIADVRRRFVVLLDVPRGLPARRITDWRSNFNSSYAAAYHPWLGVLSGGNGDSGLVAVPPSSFAAGIIAERERSVGLAWGPANELARDAVRSVDAVTDALHDQLHPLGINVFRAERDGYRLSSARTLSSDRDFRQLSVRRLMTMLALTLERQTQWLVFEPNTSELRNRLLRTVTQFLRGLQRRGAFAGRTEAESFFVRCDDSLNPIAVQQQGRLLADIGVAPASPLEYIVLRISRDADGTIAVGADRG